MLKFIYGRAGSGKTSYINSLICEMAKHDKELVLIVPEQFSFSAERKMLELLGPVDCNRVEVVMSFTHIADSVYKLYGGNRLPQLSNSGKHMLMSMAVDSVSEQLEVFASRKSSSALLDDMVSISSELRQNAIDVSDLEDTVSKIDDDLLKKKLNELSLILSSYDAMLNNKFYDPDDKLTVLASVLDEYKFFADKTVFIDGFDGFTGQEMKIIEKILLQADDTYVSLCCDELFGNELDIFSPVKKTAGKIYNLAKKNNIPIAKTEELKSDGYKSEDIEILERELFSNIVSDTKSKPDSIKIIEADNKVTECDFVASEIKRLLKKGMRAREIAVISRNGNDYEPYIKSSLKKCGVPVFSDTRAPIGEQPICVLIESALEIACVGFTNENVFRFAKTGLTDLSFEEISSLEKYALMWNIKGNRWKYDFDENPEGLGTETNDKTEEKLCKLNELRDRLIEPLDQFCRKMNEGLNGVETAESIYDLLIDTHADKNLKDIAITLEDSGEIELACEQERVWDCVMEILNDLANLVGDRRKNKDEYKLLINLAISSQDLGNIPQGLDEVTVGDALRSRTNEPKVVFVLGANDGVFPAYPGEGGTFSDRERKLLMSAGLGISDTVEDEILSEKFMCYKTLCSAKEQLYVLYSSHEMDGKEMQRSELVSEIENIFPESEIVSTADMSEDTFIESRETAFRIMASKWNDNDVLSQSLKEYFSNEDEYSGRLMSLEKLNGDKDFKIENKETAIKLFGKNMYESATKVEVFHKCAFQYFCKFGIKAKPADVSAIDPRRRGTVIHFCLENLIKIHKISGLTAMDDDTLKAEIHNILDSYAEECMGGLSNKSERFIYLYSMFEDTVFGLVKQLINEFTGSKYEPSDFELKIDYDGEVKSYKIPLDDGGSISLRGFVDRVDKYESDGKTYIRVVDYKTGGKDFVLSDVLYGLNLQMLVYLFSIWENGNKKYGEVVPAGVLYMPAGSKYVSADRNISEEELENEKGKNSKYKGILLENIDSLTAMEQDLTGKYIPAHMTKKGELKGSVASLEQIGKLRRKIDDILKGMAEHLHDGQIEAVPVCGKDYDKICEYCFYRDICCIEDDNERREVLKCDNNEVFGMLEGEGE